MPGMDTPFAIGSDVWPGLSKLIEEAGEVMQVAGKLIATGGAVEHWDGTNLAERLADEMGDLLAACAFVHQHCGLDEGRVFTRAEAKAATFVRWHAEQQPTAVLPLDGER